MKKVNVFIGVILAVFLVLTQVAGVFAASPSKPAYISGEVSNIEVITDFTTGMQTVLVTLWIEPTGEQIVRISYTTALNLKLVYYENGILVPDSDWYGSDIDIKTKDLIQDPSMEEPQHPVGGALATFFSDIEGLNYEMIMEAHQAGAGFGVIAQALWLTQKLEGNSSLFEDVLQVKQSGDYQAFFEEYNLEVTEEELLPANWGQFRKSVLAGDKRSNLGAVMSQKDSDNTDPSTLSNENSNRNKDKDKSNSGAEHSKAQDKKP